jgi:hypothetical protein
MCISLRTSLQTARQQPCLSVGLTSTHGTTRSTSFSQGEPRVQISPRGRGAPQSARHLALALSHSPSRHRHTLTLSHSPSRHMYTLALSEQAQAHSRTRRAGTYTLSHSQSALTRSYPSCVLIALSLVHSRSVLFFSTRALRQSLIVHTHPHSLRDPQAVDLNAAFLELPFG